MSLEYQTAIAADLEALVCLRIEAMRPSLQAVGRFDPQRARERFVKSFEATHTTKLLLDNTLVGFYVLLEKEQHLWLDHLYVAVHAQGQGIGDQVLKRLKSRADDAGCSLQLGALKESPANQFYLRQGFVKIAEQAWDNIYKYQA